MNEGNTWGCAQAVLEDDTCCWPAEQATGKDTGPCHPWGHPTPQEDPPALHPRCHTQVSVFISLPLEACQERLTQARLSVPLVIAYVLITEPCQA